MYAYCFTELFVQETDGELESRFVLKILQRDCHRDCLTGPYCFGVVGITVVVSNMFSFFSFFLCSRPLVKLDLDSVFVAS